eukprot:1194514-Prorocentrum_minimum.AAC.2
MCLFGNSTPCRFEAHTRNVNVRRYTQRPAPEMCVCVTDEAAPAGGAVVCALPSRDWSAPRVYAPSPRQP